jgi:PAS domain S-box-containing protein
MHSSSSNNYYSLQQQQQQQILQNDASSLPKTLEDALRPSTKRAIVVTETTKPFRICNVNKAWENLCGYAFVESKGRSLGSLLKGEETDQLAVSALLNQLMRGEEATTVLTNYTKQGRKFRNRLHVGPLYENRNSDQPTHFVGVLKEVADM